MGDKDRPIQGRRSLRDVQGRIVYNNTSTVDQNLLVQLLLEQQRQNREMQELLISIVRSKLKGSAADDLAKDIVTVFESCSKGIPVINDSCFIDREDDNNLEASFTELGEEIKSGNSIEGDLEKLRNLLKAKEVSK